MRNWAQLERKIHPRPALIAIGTLSVGLLAMALLASFVFGSEVPALGFLSPGQYRQTGGYDETQARLAAPIAVERQIPLLSLEEAQRFVDFQIPLPKQVPSNLVLAGGRVDSLSKSDDAGSLPTVVISYEDPSSPPTTNSGMFLQISDSALFGGYLVPESEKRTALVNGRKALYVSGSWLPGTEWDSDADVWMISWKDNKHTYVLSVSGLGLDLEEVIVIAESIE